MTTRRLVALSALTLAAVGFSAPAASAGQDEKIITEGGGAWFYAGGTEKIFVLDTRKDGYGVRARLRWKGGSASVHALDGAGEGLKHQKLLLRERLNVQLRLCYTNNGKNVKCSGWQRAEA